MSGPMHTGTEPPRPSAAHRPWPVVALTALGAWLSLLPLLGVLSLLFGQAWRTGPGPYGFGLLMVWGALTVMRSRGLSLFMEQLAWPVLLLGVGAMAFGFTRDLDDAGAYAALSGCALVLSGLVPQPSLRALLGAATLLLAMMGWMETGSWRDGVPKGAWAVHVAVPAVAALMAWRHAASRGGASPRWLAWAEAVLDGAAVAALASLALWSGMTMMVPAAMGGIGAAPRGGGWQASAGMWASWASWAVWAGLSAAAMALAAARVWRAWPVWRQPWWAGVLLALAGLSFAVPGLGLALAAAALCVLNHRPKLGAWAMAVTVWIVGAFYYSLAWPLDMKAVMLAAAGIALLALGWFGARRTEAMAPPGRSLPPASTAHAAADHRRGAWALPLCAAIALAGVNIGIWQKEALIRDGQPLFVALAPVDPRSLMQGDYMALAFALPPVPDDGTPSAILTGGARWYVVVNRDARGVAIPRRHDQGEGPLAPGELRVQLTLKPRGWTLATDAWFFAEGDAPRWQRARYGEFRVDARGRALLVGLRDASLQAIRP